MRQEQPIQENKYQHTNTIHTQTAATTTAATVEAAKTAAYTLIEYPWQIVFNEFNVNTIRTKEIRDGDH